MEITVHCKVTSLTALIQNFFLIVMLVNIIRLFLFVSIVVYAGTLCPDKSK